MADLQGEKKIHLSTALSRLRKETNNASYNPRVVTYYHLQGDTKVVIH